jgi:hypothetical protein
MWPLCPKAPYKFQALFKAFLLVSSPRIIIYGTFLKINGRHNRNTVSEKRICDLETLRFEHVNEIDNPRRMRRYEIRSVLQEDLWNYALRVPQSQAHQEWMCEQTKISVVQKLDKKPWPPIVSV